MIESPPAFDSKSLQKALKISDRDDVRHLVASINERYEYWTDIKYKPLPEGVSATDLWACVRISRLISQEPLTFGSYTFHLYTTGFMRRLCHEFDMNLGGYMGTQSFIPDEDKNRYLVSSNMEEAIASSQMEGAATTRRVAKDMLRKAISPRSRSEQMIVNNYRTIRYILDHKGEPLTVEQLCRIHALMTHKTLASDKEEGCFRQDDEVVVANGITHEVVHTPPPHTELPALMESLCRFFNEDSKENFIHPVVKGIIVHFLIGFFHPFADGNGRTGRALFYWFLLNRGYWLTEYLSISRIIAKTKNQYERAYLYAERDNNDLGYFVAYNLRVMDQAFTELREYIQRKIGEKSQISDFLRLGNLNERQAQMIKWLNDDPALTFTVKELESRFRITGPTAREDLKGLVEAGYLEARPVNRVKFSYVRGGEFTELVLKARR